MTERKKFLFKIKQGKTKVWDPQKPHLVAEGSSVEEAFGKLILLHPKIYETEVINSKVDDERELIELLKKSKELPFTDEGIKKKLEIEKPIAMWAEKLIYDAMKKKDPRMSLKEWCLKNDRECFGKTEEEQRADATLLDDEEITIVGYIDYDYGWTLGKFTLKSKITDLVYHHSIGFKKTD